MFCDALIKINLFVIRFTKQESYSWLFQFVTQCLFQNVPHGSRIESAGENFLTKRKIKIKSAILREKVAVCTASEQSVPKWIDQILR